MCILFDILVMCFVIENYVLFVDVVFYRVGIKVLVGRG